MIDTAINYLGKFTSFIVALLVLLVVYDATARYLFSTGSIALQELEWHLFDVIILFAIPYTLKLDAHVRVDIFYASFISALLLHLLPPSYRYPPSVEGRKVTHWV